MKLCILGNSHIAALKSGWERIKDDFPGTTLTFFGSRRKRLGDLTIERDRLIPKNEFVRKDLALTSGGQEYVAPSEYDAILIFGLYFNAFFKNKDEFYSQQSLNVAFSRRDATTCMRVFAKLRKIDKRTIYIGHVPLAAAKQVRCTNRSDAYVDGLHLLNQIYLQPRNAILCSQPIETVVNGNATHPKYAVGGHHMAKVIVHPSVQVEQNREKSKSGQPLHLDDNIHMNELFGELWLRHFFKNF